MQRLSGLVRQASAGFRLIVEETLTLRGAAQRSISAAPAAGSDPVKGTTDKAPETQFDHATGLEKVELEGLKEGKDIFHEDWITADFAGTPEDPVVVTSAFHERVVGVPDPEDDCLVVWSLIKSDEPPKQIIPGGEYFVLKHIEPEAWNTLPESFKGEVAHH